MTITLNNGWVKGFSNSEIIGSDDLVDNKMVSWSKSRLDNILYLSLYQNYSSRVLIATIEDSSGQGVFWQSDDYIAPVSFSGTTTGKRITRRIEKLITEQDKYMKIASSKGILYIRFSSETVDSICVSSDMVNKWLVIEINHLNEIKWFLSDKRI